ncbi:MAG TPA: ThuA domain-containing protein [Armatimonadota bacterium]|jgi:type 1 glutamine amidotransferase
MIKTLLLSGANNHDWTRSTPFVKDLLEQTGNYAVTVTNDPGELLADAAEVAKYDLIFSDYNGPEWGEAAKENFSAAIWDGTGLVVLHAADNAFPGWTDYEKMVGLMWREGAGHGAFHEFPVTIQDREHPITAGLADFRLWDELYHGLSHLHGVPFHVLATGYSDPASGGSGQDEPVMVTTRWNLGRIFHMVLGHVWAGDPAENKGCSMITFENPGFQQALLRGCQWAALGSVE